MASDKLKPEQVQPASSAPKQYKFEIPEVQEFLKAGVQFGHQSKKWNPKMKPFIFGSKQNIHIIDISQTVEALEKAMQFLAQAASRGEIMFVGTKRQAAEIVRQAAIDSGSHFIVHRWPGGLLSNFPMIQRTLKHYVSLEEEFEHGVEGRTKFEVSQMKKDWEKKNRLYEGIKKMSKYPAAVVIVDSHYERSAVKEAKKLKLPIIAMVDTNCDPTVIDYPIPANDDAIGSITLILGLLSKAVKAGNEGKGVAHEFKDFSKFEVKIVKRETDEEKKVEVEAAGTSSAPVRSKPTQDETTASSAVAAEGMLEGIQKAKETSKKKKPAKKA